MEGGGLALEDFRGHVVGSAKDVFVRVFGLRLLDVLVQVDGEAEVDDLRELDGLLGHVVEDQKNVLGLQIPVNYAF